MEIITKVFVVAGLGAWLLAILAVISGLHDDYTQIGPGAVSLTPLSILFYLLPVAGLGLPIFALWLSRRGLKWTGLAVAVLSILPALLIAVVVTLGSGDHM